MYKIFKATGAGLRLAAKTSFRNYESARQWARKLCRKQANRSLFDTTNPMIGDYGFTIRKVV